MANDRFDAWMRCVAREADAAVDYAAMHEGILRKAAAARARRSRMMRYGSMAATLVVALGIGGFYLLTRSGGGEPEAAGELMFTMDAAATEAPLADAGTNQASITAEGCNPAAAPAPKAEDPTESSTAGGALGSTAGAADTAAPDGSTAPGNGLTGARAAYGGGAPVYVGQYDPTCSLVSQKRGGVAVDYELRRGNEKGLGIGEAVIGDDGTGALRAVWQISETHCFVITASGLTEEELLTRIRDMAR